jgi:Protein of unknown function (DUF2442)
MRHKLTQVTVPNYPVLSITFDDGLTGEIDMARDISTKPIFAELREPEFFNQVAIDQYGASLGWRLGDTGNEIDLSADGLRNDLETAIVRKWAAEYRASRQAAE